MNAATPASRTLADPFYYLNNFRLVLEWIGARYDDLLNDEERTFLHGFAALPEVAQALLVRMVMRKGVLFRASKLDYAEIGATREAATPLLAHGWINGTPDITVEQLFALFNKADLTAITQTAPTTLSRKPELLAWAKASYPHAAPLGTWLPACTDIVYELKVDALCERLRLMFFGNLSQDWSEFVLTNLGIYTFEEVAFSAASRAFQQREDIDTYLHLARCRDALEEGTPPDTLLAQLPPPRADNPWLARRHARLVFQIAQQLERAGQFADALPLYASCTAPGARQRHIRTLEKLDQPGDAYALAQQADQHPESEAEWQQIQRMLPRLRRTLGLPGTRPGKAAPPEEWHLQLVQTPHNVEIITRDHLYSDAAPVAYVENTLFNALFGLLCWPAIFSPVPGAFFHPFHHSPADLSSADFYARRQTVFDACLGEIASGQYRQTILTRFGAKQGIQCSFVNWAVISAPLLQLALDCIPAAHLTVIFQRLLADIMTNRAGLPDLIRFWPAEQRYQLIEVKGPGDRLQDNQLRWMAYFAEHRIPVAVCYVTWADAA
ncbi:VRR-NUC domain-containing protein [Silvimonas iriomotensis]|uniref:phosphodiesterase I n=1 Tax=Silvimonas iriomotensis TaxID=449662 RepID=A0ABQ2P675_9NEIS|nr:VRR-NUC domain-containing protein [Silvimonas iriomotensis]GGP18963.1 Fanconi-associated nuclease [Silvimonas iriomotensis]